MKRRGCKFGGSKTGDVLCSKRGGCSFAVGTQGEKVIAPVPPPPPPGILTLLVYGVGGLERYEKLVKFEDATCVLKHCENSLMN